MLCKYTIILTGPTATGKTRLGIRIARKIGPSAILSVDSRQIYRHMDIGTAKPTAEERGEIEHYFIDVKEPDEPYSAGTFGKEARRRIESLWRRGKIPILVGGSGMYLQAVIDGFFEDSDECGALREHLRRRHCREGTKVLYEELRRLDPKTAAGLGPNDAPRILRALELVHSGRRMRKEHPAAPLEGTVLMFGLTMERAELYRRIDQRVDRMISDGLIDEVEGLVEKGYGRACPAMNTLGYGEILDYLEGRCDLERAVERIKSGSRRYAKRQWSWFRRDRRIRWLELDRWGIEGVEKRVIAQWQAEIGGGDEKRFFPVDSER